MEKERIVDMMERIENYIHGRLNHQEEDQLWVEFLKDPHWYSIFQTELNLSIEGLSSVYSNNVIALFGRRGKKQATQEAKSTSAPPLMRSYPAINSIRIMIA